jgi:hypothetical protein
MEVTAMSQHISIVAAFADPGEAETAVRNLHHAGFDMHKLSVVGKGLPGTQGEWNGVSMLGRLEALEQAPYTGIPRERLADYKSMLQEGRLLLVAYGSSSEIEQADHIISAAHPGNWDGRAGTALFYGCAL